MFESALGASTSSGDETDELLRALARSPDRAPPPAPGTVWGESGRYVIESRLGRGGMGVVYVARDTLLERRVALKVLSDKVEESSRRRLLGEARVAASVEHDRVARIYDVGEHDGISFVAMELVRGVTLRTFAAGRRVGASDVTHLGLQIAEGLAALHGDGIIHRDLKPENIMLSERQSIKLLDFGLALLRDLPRPARRGLVSPCRLFLTVSFHSTRGAFPSRGACSCFRHDLRGGRSGGAETAAVLLRASRSAPPAV